MESRLDFFSKTIIEQRNNHGKTVRIYKAKTLAFQLIYYHTHVVLEDTNLPAM